MTVIDAHQHFWVLAAHDQPFLHSHTAGVALGPAASGALLATSPDAVWWGGTLTVALTGAGLLRLGDRIPDPLLHAQSRPPQAVSAADTDAACHSQMNSTEMECHSRT